ncbi:MAG TPA: helix-turn-helix domain-containing protein [Candidatus Nitrosotalea sp.]|nr:helix-turn-helix domain-containing protein [Candidatus Nitrosotalea sp.]
MPSLTGGRSTRMEVLGLLRRKHAASAEAISSALGITPNAVRQHLTNLERDGLVRSTPEHHKRGRPSLLFSLTDRADAEFPKRYGQLATMILTEIREIGGPDLLDDVVGRVAARHARQIEPMVRGLPFEQAVNRIVQWIRRSGTMAEAEPQGEGIMVTIHNCPFRSTALKFPQICGLTPRLILHLTGAQVSQCASIHRGDPHCSFVVQNGLPSSTQRR